VLLWLIIGWLLIALYPDPSLLIRSITNIRNPSTDASSVRELAATLPDDPRLIEEAVLNRILPYAYDWQTWGVPWYFPTAAEALAAGRGDCESRAVVLAGLLEAKGIPHKLLMSFDHIWVDYPGKTDNALENASVVLAQRVDGRFVWAWPAHLHLGAEVATQIATFWTPMPTPRRLLLFGGVLLLLMLNPLLKRYGHVDDAHGLDTAAPATFPMIPPLANHLPGTHIKLPTNRQS
jgi:hypothetical protein